jgi:hypothetical protein
VKTEQVDELMTKVVRNRSCVILADIVKIDAWICSAVLRI